jgi:hypothetical protein
MNARFRLVVSAVVVCAGVVAGGRWSVNAQPAAVPRTSWGTPDFQGVTWNFATMTPLERPRGIDKPELTVEETVVFERETAKTRAANVNNGYDWWDDGAAHLDRRRTSLIIDPPDGHLPAPAIDAPRRRRPASANPEGPEDFALNARCIFWQNAGPPMVPSPYNNNVQFVQTRDYVVISNENIHDARVIPMNGRPHGTVPQWMGDSRGRWEGDTLVIDTISFSTKTSVSGSDERLHVIERFTRLDADTLAYQFTVDDATVWSRPWTAAFPLHRINQPIYEFACHEGNAFIMEDMLRVARAQDKP